MSNLAIIIPVSIIGVYLTGAIATGITIYCMTKNHVGQVADGKCRPILIQSALWPVFIGSYFC